MGGNSNMREDGGRGRGWGLRLYVT